MTATVRQLHRRAASSLARMPQRELLLLLLAADALFMLLHLGYLTPGFAPDEKLSLSTDRGAAEGFQYAKAAWLAVMFIWIGRRRAERAFVVWALLCVYLLADDSFMIHERAGMWVAARFELSTALGLRPADFGELATHTAIGLVFGSALVAAYRAGSPAFRRMSRVVVGLFAVLACFGVGVDMLHEQLASVLGPRSLASIAASGIEDGGELVATSVLAWYVFHRLVAERPGVQEDAVGRSGRRPMAYEATAAKAATAAAATTAPRASEPVALAVAMKGERSATRDS